MFIPSNFHRVQSREAILPLSHAEMIFIHTTTAKKRVRTPLVFLKQPLTAFYAARPSAKQKGQLFYAALSSPIYSSDGKRAAGGALRQAIARIRLIFRDSVLIFYILSFRWLFAKPAAPRHHDKTHVALLSVVRMNSC